VTSPPEELAPRPLARRMSGIEPFRVMDVMSRAAALEREGRSIIHMEVGEPDFPTPEPVREAAARALAGCRTLRGDEGIRLRERTLDERTELGDRLGERRDRHCGAGIRRHSGRAPCR
jgi:hypothetical protein